jgi:translation initiation factor 1
MAPSKPRGGLVYSTELGRVCPACGQAIDHCACRARDAALPQGDGKVRVSRDSKGRGGKTVTVVRGLPLDAPALARVGKELRSACGSGGTVKDGVIEIQGDHVARVLELLAQQGWKPRQAGG